MKKMNRFMWVLLILLLILTLAQIWRMENREAPAWTKCKESLFIQTVFNKCTQINIDGTENSLIE